MMLNIALKLLTVTFDRTNKNMGVLVRLLQKVNDKRFLVLDR